MFQVEEVGRGMKIETADKWDKLRRQMNKCIGREGQRSEPSPVANLRDDLAEPEQGVTALPE
jgi:hypothetical protein